MTVLGVDTSTKSCSVAVVSADGLMAELTLDNDQTHARYVMTMIDQVLSLAGIQLSQLDGMAVTRGPGSFTGLRIGLSTIKGLAQALNKPVVPVSSLEVLAYQIPPVIMPIIAMIDAFRNEIYMAMYKYEKDQLVRVTDESVIAPEKVTLNVPSPVLLVGNGAKRYRDILSATLGELAWLVPDRQNNLRAATVAELGLERLHTMGRDAQEITPVYLRKSDAELNRDKVLSRHA